MTYNPIEEADFARDLEEAEIYIIGTCNRISPDNKYSCRKSPEHITLCKAIGKDLPEWCRKCNKYVSVKGVTHICEN